MPFLGDITILGKLFKSTETKKTKTGLLLFLAPHVATVSYEMKGIPDDEWDGTKIMTDAVEEGMFEDQPEDLNRGSPKERERRHQADARRVDEE